MKHKDCELVPHSGWPGDFLLTLYSVLCVLYSAAGDFCDSRLPVHAPYPAPV